MKKINFFSVGIFLLQMVSLNAQVTVTNSSTIKLGSTNNYIGTDNSANFGDAAGISFYDNSSSPGILIEQGNTESSGIFMDEDKIVMWSPGDDNLVIFCDEDFIESDWYEAIVAYIDESGYYYQNSDSTCKENIQNISASLSKIMQLRGVEYNHKSTTDVKGNNTLEKKNNSNDLKCGFLAQEVETVIPEAVATNKEGKKYVNYQAVIPFLVEALKEQQTQIDSQDKQIKLLQEQITAIQQSLGNK